MKSMVVTQFGGPEVIEAQEVPIPEPQTDELRIRVKAAGINYADIMQREGLYPRGPKPPFTAGFEVTGVVDRAGEGSVPWRAGDEVMAFCTGGYSEYAIAKTAEVYPKPAALDFTHAAAIPCQYLTAYHALVTLGRLAKGETVLIHAAAGGLGTLLVQIARNRGATVIGTASTDEKCALIQELGAAHAINYAEKNFMREVRAITKRQGCDLIIESIGGEVFDQSLPCLKSRGVLITLGAACKTPGTVSAVHLLVNNWTVAGFHLFAYTSDTGAMEHAMNDLDTWLAQDKLTILAKHVFPLAQAAQAQQLVSDRKSTGKVVLVPEE